MAILTPTGTGNVNLSTASGFYRVEASNFYFLGTGTFALSLSSDRTIAVTFSNAGNLTGIFLGLVGPADKSVTVKLQQNTGSWVDVAGCTVTATAAQISNSTTVANGLWIYKFVFGTPAAVTTAASTWRFYISNATGTTNWSVNTSDTTNIAYAAYCDNLLSFTNDDAIIVAGSNTITVDGDYSLKGVLATGVTTTGTALVLGSHTSYTSSTVGNLLVDSSAARTLTIDGIIALASHGGPRIGSSASRVPIATSLLIDFITPTVGTASGIRCVNNSTSSSKPSFIAYGEVPTYQRTTLAYDAAAGGTVTMTIADPCVVTKATHTLRNGTPVRFTTTGALPTGVSTGTTYWTYSTGTSTLNLYDTYAHAIAGGATGRVATSGTQSGTHTLQSIIITTDTTGWSIGDSIFVGGSAQAGGLDVTARTISSISTTEIVLSANLTHNKYSDGAVVRTNGYGIKVRGYNSANCILEFGGLSNFQLSGIQFDNINIRAGYNTVTTNNNDDAANRSDWLIEDCSYFRTTAALFLTSLTLPPNNTVIQRVNTVNGNIVGNIYSTTSSISSVAQLSGNVEINYCWSIHTANTAFSIGSAIAPSTTAVPLTIDHCRWECGGNTIALICLGFVNTTLTNNKFWGQYTGSFVYGAINVFTSVNLVSANNTYDFNSVGIAFQSVPVINSVFTNESFGVTGANNYSVYIASSSYLDVIFKSPTGTITEYGSRTEIITGSQIAITDENDVVNVDRVLKREGNFVRCGDGLVDTTVHTSGTDKYSLRFESTSSTELLPWEFFTPVGNIQNMDMVVIVWCKINSATYYSGTNQLPRLTVNYDDGTLAYAQAATSTAWQPLIVTINPTTTYGQLTLKLSTMTDATGSNAYVYFDDFSVLYPAGHVLNLGGMDLWANALPITPPISTSISALDVWAADPSTFGAGTVGEMVKTTSIKVDDAAIINGLTV